MDPLELAQMGVSTLGNIFGGIMKGNAFQEEERADKQAAIQADAEAGVQSSMALQQGDEVAARAATQAAANGGGGGIAQSSLGVISDLSSRAMFNARSAVYQGVTQSNADLYKAKIAGDNATNSFIGAGLSAGGSALGDIMKDNAQNRYFTSMSQMRGQGGYYGMGMGGGW